MILTFYSSSSSEISSNIDNIAYPRGYVKCSLDTPGNQNSFEHLEAFALLTVTYSVGNQTGQKSPSRSKMAFNASKFAGDPAAAIG